MRCFHLQFFFALVPSGEFRASGREFLCPRRQRNQNAAEPTVRTPFSRLLRQLTIPKFNSAKILNRPYYSLEEIRLINQLGLAYSNLGDHKKAVGIFSQLHTYVVERNYGLSKSGGGMPLVAHNYARELTIRKQYEDALDIANEGQAVCLEYGHYQYLPGLIHIMAECQHFLGNDEESKNLYNRAYRLYQEYGNIYNCSILEREVQTYHRTDLDF